MRLVFSNSVALYSAVQVAAPFLRVSTTLHGLVMRDLQSSGLLVAAPTTVSARLSVYLLSTLHQLAFLSLWLVCDHLI